MQKAALVLSGGGANGAFQVGAESVLSEVFNWTAVHGVSAGALNATLIGQGRQERMAEIWLNEFAGLVKKRSWWKLWGLINGTKGIYDTRKLRGVVRKEIWSAPYVIPTYVGFVDMLSGQYYAAHYNNPRFISYAIASSAIPIIFDQQPGALADGGLRNSTPLGDAAAHGHRRIVVITNRPKDLGYKSKLKGVLDIFGRTLEILTHELAEEDLKVCVLKNELAEHNPNSPHRHIDLKILRPSKPLGDALEFTLEHSRAAYEQGINDAEAFVGAMNG